MGLRSWLEGRREEERVEAEDAATGDRDLRRLKEHDPDAARTFTATFTAARTNRRVQDLMTEQLQQYARLKHNAGRLDLYNQIFASLNEE